MRCKVFVCVCTLFLLLFKFESRLYYEKVDESSGEAAETSERVFWMKTLRLRPPRQTTLGVLFTDMKDCFFSFFNLWLCFCHAHFLLKTCWKHFSPGPIVLTENSCWLSFGGKGRKKCQKVSGYFLKLFFAVFITSFYTNRQNVDIGPRFDLFFIVYFLSFTGSLALTVGGDTVISSGAWTRESQRGYCFNLCRIFTTKKQQKHLFLWKNLFFWDVFFTPGSFILLLASVRKPVELKCPMPF